jgi:hypothetical protein
LQYLPKKFRKETSKFDDCNDCCDVCGDDDGCHGVFGDDCIFGDDDGCIFGDDAVGCIFGDDDGCIFGGDDGCIFDTVDWDCDGVVSISGGSCENGPEKAKRDSGMLSGLKGTMPAFLKAASPHSVLYCFHTSEKENLFLK